MDSLRDAYWARERVKELELTLLLAQHPDRAWKDRLSSLFSDLSVNPPRTAPDSIAACKQFLDASRSTNPNIPVGDEGMNNAIQLLAIKLGAYHTLSTIFKNAEDWDTSIKTVALWVHTQHRAKAMGTTAEALFAQALAMKSPPPLDKAL
jgi:hypothetical protein